MTTERDKSRGDSARLIAEIPAAVALFDRDLRYVAVSAAWADAFGLDSANVTGQRHGAISAAGRATLEHVQHRALAGESLDEYPTGTDATLGLRGATLSGRPQRGAAGGIAGVIAVLRTADAAAVGKGDALPSDLSTPLPERTEFAQRLQEVLADPDPSRRILLVLAINLENLRGINTLHGFTVGDQVLKITADRLLSGTRAQFADEDAPARRRDMVARLGAGEFGIICTPAAPALIEGESLAARLLRIVQSPIAIGDRSLRLLANVGFLMTTATHRNSDDALRDLDLALQQARMRGPGKITAWEPSLTTTAARNYTLAEELQRAFENGEFVLHYQPVLRLGDYRMVGAEALLRWNHPRDGLAPTASFVPVLEQTGLIGEVGCWVVREAVRQVESWRTLYGRNIVDSVGINISARQLSDPSGLLATLRSIHAGGFSVHRLKLEIAEPVLMRQPQLADTVFTELRGLGIGLAIDDFGTGGSSLESVRRFAADAIKIDGRFIAQIGTPDGDKLLQALLDVARMSGAAVIAEGIETAAQRDFLREVGCGFGQGYLLAQPMDGALLGAFALTHAVAVERGLGGRPASGEIGASAWVPISRTSAGPLPEG